MLYWGSQGIKRDTAAALDYYRQAAESGDPQALYDYGIVLLKVSFHFCNAVSFSGIIRLKDFLLSVWFMK